MTYRRNASWRGLGAIFAAGTPVAGQQWTQEQVQWSNGVGAQGYGGYPAPEYRGRAILPDGSFQDAAHAMNDNARIAHAGELAAGVVPPLAGTRFSGGYCFYLDADGNVTGSRLVYPARELLTWAVQHPQDAGGADVLDAYLAVNPYGLPASVAAIQAQVTTPQAQYVVAPVLVNAATPVHAFGLPDAAPAVALQNPDVLAATVDPIPATATAASVDAQGATEAGMSWMPWALAAGAVFLMTRGGRR